MHVLKSLLDTVYSIIQWIHGQFRTIRGQEGVSLSDRLFAAITLASIVMIVVFAVKLIQTHSRVHITLATAGEGDKYYWFGENLKKVINNNQKRIRIKTRPTHGSRENMQLLENREVGLAIIQHDTSSRMGTNEIVSLKDISKEHFIRKQD